MTLLPLMLAQMGDVQERLLSEGLLRLLNLIVIEFYILIDQLGKNPYQMLLLLILAGFNQFM